VDLARACRFSDYRHGQEPGCAVLAAIDAGALDAARLARFNKLAREDRRNSEPLHERRARDRAFGKMTKAIMKAKEDR
jgi:ribosome biogenesis GTPase